MTPELLQLATQDAITFWRTEGLGVSSLSGIDIRISDLSDSVLGLAYSDSILMDRDAAGFGWSVGASPAPGRVDLLSAVTHEIGHVLGFEHDAAFDVMRPTLTPGVSRVSSPIGPVAGTIVQRLSTYPALASADLDLQRFDWDAEPNWYQRGSSLRPVQTQRNGLNADEVVTLSPQQPVVDLVLGEVTGIGVLDDTLVEELALYLRADDEEARVLDNENDEGDEN